MKEFIKSYHLFLSQRWLRWIIYLVYPALLLAGFVGLDFKLTTNPPADADIDRLYWLIIYNLCDIALTLEFCMDYLILGGIAAKYTNKLEYLKTSVKGMTYLKKALITDALRRLLSLSIVIGIPCALSAPYYNWVNGIGIVLLMFFFIELGLLIIRHFISFTANWLAVSIFFLFIPACTVLIRHAPTRTGILLPLIPGIITAILGRWLIIRKARKSYYDSGNEKSN